MNWDTIRQFVETWAAEHNLPADLGKFCMELVHFEAEDACRFFYPDRDVLSHEAFLNSLARWVRDHHGRTRRVTITPEHYRAWLIAEKGQDTAESRTKFIESRYRLFPLKR